jgi:hypothetical protein
MSKLECLDGLNGGGWGVFITPTTIPAVVVDGNNGQSGGAPDTQCSLPVRATSADRWGLEPVDH